jgi:hypothetical protein
VLSVPKRTPRILLNTDEYPECVETTPRVFGPVTLWHNFICQEHFVVRGDK